MCGDKAMVTRGAANYTWNQGFAVCQERLKRLKAQRARAETKEVDSLSSEFRVQSHGRPAAPGKFGKTPKCDRCGRDGPNDYNCCHAGGAWAGMCGDKAMITRGAANYTWDQGFAVCQERLKRLKAQRAKNLTKEVDSLYGRPAAAPGHGGPGAGHGGGHSGRGERGAGREGREGSGAVGGAGAGAAWLRAGVARGEPTSLTAEMLERLHAWAWAGSRSLSSPRVSKLYDCMRLV